jgi:predicted Zn-dependent protease
VHRFVHPILAMLASVVARLKGPHAGTFVWAATFAYDAPWSTCVLTFSRSKPLEAARIGESAFELVVYSLE